MICKLFTNFLEYTFILFDGTNRICVCKSIKTTKRVQASTIACSSSAMLKQHGSTRSSRWARHVERVYSCRDVTWRATWNLGLSVMLTKTRGSRTSASTRIRKGTRRWLTTLLSIVQWLQLEMHDEVFFHLELIREKKIEMFLDPINAPTTGTSFPCMRSGSFSTTRPHAFRLEMAPAWRASEMRRGGHLGCMVQKCRHTRQSVFILKNYYFFW